MHFITFCSEICLSHCRVIKITVWGIIYSLFFNEDEY